MYPPPKKKNNKKTKTKKQQQQQKTKTDSLLRAIFGCQRWMAPVSSDFASDSDFMPIPQPRVDSDSTLRKKGLLHFRLRVEIFHMT